MHLKLFFVSCVFVGLLGWIALLHADTRYMGEAVLVVADTDAQGTSAAPHESEAVGTPLEQPTQAWTLLEGTLFDVLVFGGEFSGNFVDFFLLGVFLLVAYKARGVFQRKHAPLTDNEDDDLRLAPDALSLSPDMSDQTAVSPENSDPIDDTSFTRSHDIDTEEVLAYAKGSFLRLQASWDRRDLGDIALFTSPQFFEEIQLQYAEDPEPSLTDIHITAVHVVDTKTYEGQQWVRVYFDVFMRTGVHDEDAQNAGVTQDGMRVREVWYFVRSLDHDDMWQLDNIQPVEA